MNHTTSDGPLYCAWCGSVSHYNPCWRCMCRYESAMSYAKERFMSQQTSPNYARIALHRIRRQEEWIAEQGQTRAGYIARYGSADDISHYGEGGEAIYEADQAELRRLELLAADQLLRKHADVESVTRRLAGHEPLQIIKVNDDQRNILYDALTGYAHNLPLDYPHHESIYDLRMRLRPQSKEK